MNIAQLKTTDEYPSKQSVALFCWRNGKVRWMSVAADFSLSLSASVETFATTLTLHTQNCICTQDRNRTGTALLPSVFETDASTNSATRAYFSVAKVVFFIPFQKFSCPALAFFSLFLILNSPFFYFLP